MTRERLMNIVGLVLLLGCFVASLGRILMTRFSSGEDGKQIVTIRIAHWQLEGGIRAAFDAIAAEYMKIHPNVRVVQIPIPERIYGNWAVTQLVGGTAPDIVAIGKGTNDERLSRFFEPLTYMMEKPNPYNVGTPLEGVPLRSTFFDGGEGGYNPALFEYFGIPISAFTIRVYYNADLLRKVTGSGQIPQTFEEFIGVFDKVREYNKKTGDNLLPVAGSKYNGPMLMDRLFASQTQKRMAEIFPPFYPNPTSVTMLRAIANEDFSMDSPEVRSGVELMLEIAKNMQPGFFQLLRDDAMFYFVQGRALAIASGSWDSTSIRQQAPFPLAIGPIPLPTQATPRFGANVLGQISEAGTNAGVQLGLTRSSKHPEIAKDFLFFIASEPMQKLWTEVSGWLPAVTVPPSGDAAAFTPIEDGYLAGVSLRHFGDADMNRVLDSNFYILTSPDGGVDAFIDVLRKDVPDAMRADLVRANRNHLVNTRRTDTLLGAAAWLSLTNTGDQDLATKFDLIIQSSSANDRSYNQSSDLLKKLKP